VVSNHDGTSQEKGIMTAVDNLTGLHYGKLLVIQRACKPENSTRKLSGAWWSCFCDPDCGGCGTIKPIMGTDLKSGRVLSCGCSKGWKKKPEGISTFNRLVRQYKRHAMKRGYEFSLSNDEIRELTSQNCFYCGIEPMQVVKSEFNNGNYIYNGIDRINSSLGYFIENCVSCCHQCNRAKSDMTTEKFLTWIEQVNERKQLILCQQIF
jgi:hypothetical protein